jgi:hypothetical protein
MSTYRDRLTQDFDSDIGSVVGCALDRLDRPVTQHEILKAVDYYKNNAADFLEMPIGTRRDVIASLFIR